MTAERKIAAAEAESPAVKQRRAADPARSVWVSASAGTGKTKVLTDRLLRLLLPRESGAPGTAPSRILCLTFTKAAAREMALRLNKRLAGWASMTREKLAEDLRGLLGRAATDDEMAAARRLFAGVTDAPDGLKILTIHAFCQSLLGRFPLEAGLTPNFRVAEDTGSLRERARDDVLGQARTEPQSALGLAASRVARQIAIDKFDALLTPLVRPGVLKLFDANEMHDRLATSLHLEKHERDEDALLTDACADASFDGAALRAAAKAMAVHGTEKSDQPKAEVILRWLNANESIRAKRIDDYALAFLTKKGEPLANPVTKNVRQNAPDAEDAMRAEADRLLILFDRRQAARCAGLTHDLLALGAAVSARYAALKETRGELDYDDLIEKTRELFSTPDRSAWVMYKLDGGLDHLLIDEAQDTSPAQWDIIRHLAEDFFTGQGARDEAERTIFAVGDEKQSIYSFQGARPEKFLEMRAYFSERVRAAKRIWWTESLDRSFRSTPSILKLVDAVFAHDATRAGVSVEPVYHDSNRKGQAGCVELWPIFHSPEKEEREPFTALEKAHDSRSGSSRLAEHIGETIQQWLKDGEILPARGRAMHAGDILILVQRRTAFVGQLIRALKTRGIPVSGVDRMILKNELAVQDLVAAAQFALLPQDDLSLACLLKSPLIGWDDAALEAVALDRKETLWAAVSATAGPERAWLDSLIANAASERPFEFFSGLLQQPCPASDRSGLAAMTARLGHEAVDPLQEFLNLALATEQMGAPSLQRFLIAFEKAENEIKREQEEAGASVRIMTAHGAKGLQAPIVILPDTIQVRKPAIDRLIWPDRSGLSMPIWSPRKEMDCSLVSDLLAQIEEKQEEESRRLLYVALTRAEDRLYIAGHCGASQPLPQSWYLHVQTGMARLGGDMTELPFVSRHLLPGEKSHVLSRLENLQTDKAEPDTARTVLATAMTDLPSWVTRSPDAEPYPARPLAPSRSTDSETPARSPLVGVNIYRFRRGVVTHRLLQMLPDVPAQQRAARAERFVERHASDLPTDVRAGIVSETLSILENPDWAPLFGSQSLAEISVTGMAGDTLVSGQIDRLYLTDTEAWIVDYKTNRPPPVGPDAVLPIYRAQMAAYRKLIGDIYPGRGIRCFLLWTDGPVLMEIEV